MEAFLGKRELQDTNLYSTYYKNSLRGYNRNDKTIKNFINILMNIRPLSQKKSLDNLNLLDIGSATGIFLDISRDFGMNVVGVEISPELKDYSVNNFNLLIYSSIFEIDESINKFDVITLNDVIEHLPINIISEIFSKIDKLLKNDGILVIRTPLEDAFLRRVAKILYFGTFKLIEGPMHLFYSYEHLINFSKESLSVFLSKYRLLKIYREEENEERLNLNFLFKYFLKISYLFSFFLNLQHKGVLIFKKSSK